jgi:hypothetical protein
MAEICPLCLDDGAVIQAHIVSNAYMCSGCGAWSLLDDASTRFENAVQDDKSRNLIRNFIYQSNQKKVPPIPNLGSKELDIILSGNLPSTQEQLDRLIIYIGSNTALGKLMHFTGKEIYRLLGSDSPRSVDFLIGEAKNQGLLNGNSSGIAINNAGILHSQVQLTFSGRKKFDAASEERDSKLAFMAMKFAPDLKDFYSVVKLAVAETGFNLFRLDDDEAVRAGSIDERLKVSIKTSRFLVADLTYSNQGVYWEAGYAEGLNRKVILTCREDWFKDVHFDKNHDLIIKWTPGTLEEDLKRLKAVIRNEFFDEVRKDNLLDFTAEIPI